MLGWALLPEPSSAWPGPWLPSPCHANPADASLWSGTPPPTADSVAPDGWRGWQGRGHAVRVMLRQGGIYRGAAASPVLLFTVWGAGAQLQLSPSAQQVPCAGLCTGLGQPGTVTRSGPVGRSDG